MYSKSRGICSVDKRTQPYRNYYHAKPHGGYRNRVISLVIDGLGWNTCIQDNVIA